VLDILSSAAVGGLESVTVTVRKDPSAWKGTVAEKLVDLDALKTPHTVFDGPVREGARLYPQNVNISAAAALSGLGLDRTRVVIVADPTITTHIVELEAKGTFGRFTFMEDVAISEENRKTGKLVAMAMVKSVRQLASTLVVAA
jgi:aspartate dehydrogenase